MATYNNITGLRIPDSGGGVVPQTLTVAGAPASITSLTITLTGFYHTFPQDLDFLLVAPDGTSNLVFWSDAFDGGDAVGATLTFADSAASTATGTTVGTGGVYKPTNVGANENAATFGLAGLTLNNPASAGTATFASAFTGVNPNGTWTIYAVDGGGADTGYVGGWTLVINEPSLTVTDRTIAEGAAGSSNMTFTVTRSGDVSGTTTVNYATQDVTATAGSDYTAASGLLTFAPTETTKTVVVPILGDATTEGHETFKLNLSGATNAAVVTSSATGTIYNDDGTPSLSITAMTEPFLHLEGTAAGSEAWFFVESSVVTAGTQTFKATTTAGTATSATDYTPVNGTTFTIPAGSIGGILAVKVTKDSTVETNEDFTLTLSNPGGTTPPVIGAQSSAVWTIVDDDGPPTFSITGVTRSEGAAGTTTFDFRVTRDGNPSGTASVDFATANGTATAGVDYVAAAGTLSFVSGETSKLVSVTVNGDTLVEPDETFTLTLSNPTGATIATATATGTITNDDVPPAPTGNANSPGAGGATTNGVTPSNSPPTQAPTILFDFTNLLRYQTYSGAPLPETVTTPDGKVLPNPLLEQQKVIVELITKVDAGTLSLQAAQDIIVDMADGTTSVATMTYQFFSGKLPTKEGLDYLVSSPQNPNDLNDGFYAGMSLENRYINFAVNLGKQGEGRADFSAKYGSLSLADATAKAYLEIFGKPADAAKVAAILTADRSSYFLSLGGDPLGQKAAMVGFLLAEAAKTDTGPYAVANENFLYDLLDGTAAFGASAAIYTDAGPKHVALIGVADAG